MPERPLIVDATPLGAGAASDGVGLREGVGLRLGVGERLGVGLGDASGEDAPGVGLSGRLGVGDAGDGERLVAGPVAGEGDEILAVSRGTVPMFTEVSRALT